MVPNIHYAAMYNRLQVAMCSHCGCATARVRDRMRVAPGLGLARWMRDLGQDLGEGTGSQTLR